MCHMICFYHYFCHSRLFVYILFFFLMLSLIECSIFSDLAISSFLFFFCSIRRRHTSCALVTWSSDVCSSELVGTGCTFVGVAKALKRANPGTVGAAVEPLNARPLAGEPVLDARHELQGIGYGTVPPHWDPSLMDMSVGISDDEDEERRRTMAHSEGLYVGYYATTKVYSAAQSPT